MHRRFAFLFALLVPNLVLAPPSQAEAQTVERPFFVGGGLGAALELDSYPTQFLAGVELGYHLLGTTDGPFIGASLAGSFGSDVYTFQGLARFGWDIAVLRGDVGVLLAPSLAPGITVAAVDTNTPFGRVSGSDAAFDLQAAFDVKLLLLGERLALFVRPVAIDVLFHESGTAARWNLLIGANARF